MADGRRQNNLAQLREAGVEPEEPRGEGQREAQITQIKPFDYAATGFEHIAMIRSTRPV